MDDSCSRRRERRMALDALEKDARSVWPDLPERYRVDRECILTALRSRHLPPKSEFERQFPQWLRFDRLVVLGFCARDDFVDLYKERHLFVPECLTHDKEVMLAYCRKIPRSLQECSDELTNDRDVVMAAIQLDGLELQYASRQLQETKDIVVAACQKDGRALEFCPPGPIRDELVNDRDFMLSVLRKHGGPMLRLVPEPLKNDRELLLEALKHGMRFRYCPFEYQTDSQFLLQALAHRSSLYLEMNRTTQMQRTVAHAALISESSTPQVQEKVLAQPHLQNLMQERDVALSICRRGDATFVRRYLAEDIMPAHYKDDYQVMLTAVQRDSKLFAHASPRLKRENEIIMAAIDQDSACDVLAAVGHEALRQHPAIAIRAISVYPRRHLRLLRPHIPQDLWTTNRQVAMAYIQHAGRVLDAFDPLLQTDVEMALLVAEHASPDFGRVGEALRGDMQFMKRAVDRNGRVLRFAPPLLRDDMALVVRAVANTVHSIRGMGMGTNTATAAACRFTKEEIQTHVQQKLDLHQTFVDEFLRGIAIVRPHLPPAQRSQLSMLDRGVETSQAFKRLIAEFLGVPIGEELRILRTARVNLSQPAKPDPRDERESIFMVDRWARRRLHRAARRGEDIPGAAAAERAGIQLGVLFPPGRQNVVVLNNNNNNNAAGAGAGVAADAGNNNVINNNAGGGEDAMPRGLLRRRRGPWHRGARLMAAGGPVPLPRPAAQGNDDVDMMDAMFFPRPPIMDPDEMMEEELFHMMWGDHGEMPPMGGLVGGGGQAGAAGAPVRPPPPPPAALGPPAVALPPPLNPHNNHHAPAVGAAAAAPRPPNNAQVVENLDVLFDNVVDEEARAAADDLEMRMDDFFLMD